MVTAAASFQLQAPFEPTGDQPVAIAQLVKSIQAGDRFQTLLGATGTGKTFSTCSGD
jgi:Excinuclease ABC subunit B